MTTLQWATSTVLSCTMTSGLAKIVLTVRGDGEEHRMNTRTRGKTKTKNAQGRHSPIPTGTWWTGKGGNKWLNKCPNGTKVMVKVNFQF